MHNCDAQQHRAGQIISPLTLQTITTAQMLSVGVEGVGVYRAELTWSRGRTSTTNGSAAWSTRSMLSTKILASRQSLRQSAKGQGQGQCYKAMTNAYSPASIASNVFDSLWDFSTTFRRRCNLLFQFRLQIFRRRVGIFSHFFLCCFYFRFKIYVNFSSVFYRD